MAGASVFAKFTGPIPLFIGAAVLAILGIVLIVLGGTTMLVIGIASILAAAFLAYDAWVDMQSKRA